MKKYKVLKEMPGMPVGAFIYQSYEDPKIYKLGNIITKNKYKLSVDYVNSFPDFFEEIEYLTTTEDGVDVKEFDIVSWCIYGCCTSTWEYRYELTVVDAHLSLLNDKSTYRIYSNKEAAEEFCEKENKTIFFKGLPVLHKGVKYYTFFDFEDGIITFSVAHILNDFIVFDYLGKKRFNDITERLEIMCKIKDYFENKG